MGKKSKAAAMHLDDSLGGKRRVKNITDLDLKDGGGAEATFDIEGNLIGFNGFEGGYTLSTTIELAAGDDVKYWRLRESREEVNVTVEFKHGHRVQFRGVLAKYDPKGDNQGKATASVEWALGAPDVLKD